MALIVDYASLQAAISDWSWRANDAAFTGNVTTFIDNFERGFKREQRTLEMQTTSTAALTNGQVAVPPDFLEAIVLRLVGLGTGLPDQVLKYVTPARAEELDTTTSPAGAPQWFTVVDGNFSVVPSSWVPAGASLKLTYYAFAQLSASVTSNWLITKHPDIYLYGSLLHGSAYIDDKETVAFWKSGHDDAMDALADADRKAKVVGPLVMKPSMGFRTSRQRLPFTGH